MIHPEFDEGDPDPRGAGAGSPHGDRADEAEEHGAADIRWRKGYRVVGGTTVEVEEALLTREQFHDAHHDAVLKCADEWQRDNEQMIADILDERDKANAERARLEGIAITMGAENKKLELKVERLQRDMEERGKVNARLNKEKDLAQRLVSRLPLCQDHRDKFHAPRCLACELEQRAPARSFDERDGAPRGDRSDAGALYNALRDYFEATPKSMSYPQCQEYGIPFTAEVAAANTRKAVAIARLKAIYLTMAQSDGAPAREVAERDGAPRGDRSDEAEGQ